MNNSSQSCSVLPFRGLVLTGLVSVFLGLDGAGVHAAVSQDRKQDKAQGIPNEVKVIVDRSGRPAFQRLVRSIPGVGGSAGKSLTKAFEQLRESALAGLLKGDLPQGIDRRALEQLLREHPCGGLEVDDVETLVASTLKALGNARKGAGPGDRTGDATLVAHGSSKGKNNYVQATYNFWFATRDDAKLTLNRWDVKFVESRGAPMLDVARHRKTESVMADLGEIPLADITDAWTAEGMLVDGTKDKLEAHVGHTYVMHIVDREHAYWVALHVTSIDPKDHTVSFDWRRF